ncbi:MAG: hypothetical protein PHE02_08405 [Lachnospiraceae bacterium]|nr:hypothetical protein [Lachnospiraceae bacterium]
MAIGPIETNGTIGRMQDMSIMKQNEDNKPVLDQNNFQHTFHKEVENKASQVNHADDAENNEYQYDAKKKGNGQYSDERNPKKKKKEKETSDRVVIKGQSHFDIKI